MFKSIFLDSAPLSLLAMPIRLSAPALVQSIRNWAVACELAGHRIYVPEITDYEVRRELLRANKQASIVELDALKTDFAFVPLTSTAMLKAAELWAALRQAGQPTANDENIDVDVILAAQALTFDLPGTTIVIATANIRHLSRVVPAEKWQNIVP